jgi:hypothetical protein
MREDLLDDLGPYASSLIRPVDDYIPDRGAIDKVGEYSPKADETLSIPRTECQIRMEEHLLRVFERPALGPGGLVE